VSRKHCLPESATQRNQRAEAKKIPAQVVHGDVREDVFLGKNEEGINDDPPHQQDEDVQRAGEHPLAFIGLMRTNGHSRHEGYHVQEQNDVPRIGVGDWPAKHDFKPGPACLVETPHAHAHRHQAPEQAGMTTAVEGVSGGEEEGGSDRE
jgi:hypothetical protein